jgi:hypothetical protein
MKATPVLPTSTSIGSPHGPLLSLTQCSSDVLLQLRKNKIGNRSAEHFLRGVAEDSRSELVYKIGLIVGIQGPNALIGYLDHFLETGGFEASNILLHSFPSDMSRNAEQALSKSDNQSCRAY